MSSFNGFIKEIPNVSIDSFVSQNLMSTAYFLSHAHKDHMRGMNETNFFNHLSNGRDNGYYLYCSEVTKIFLENSYNQHILEFVRTLPLGSTTVTIPSSEAWDIAQEVEVTLIPAGHCPGSVMFLFETDKERILYTGDFRIDIQDFIKFIKSKKSIAEKRINKIYLDTTFLDPDYEYFPTRYESASKVCEVINEWLQQNSNTVISIETPDLNILAHCGSEYIFTEIWDQLHMQIHVKQSVYDQYRGIEEIIRCLTTDGSSTKIHSCKRYISNRFRKPQNNECSAIPTRVIKPSAMWFRNCKPGQPIIKQQSDHFWSVAASSHASYSELNSFIRLLNPREIHPNVYSTKCSKAEVKKRLRLCQVKSWIIKPSSGRQQNVQLNNNGFQIYAQLLALNTVVLQQKLLAINKIIQIAMLLPFLGILWLTLITYIPCI